MVCVLAIKSDMERKPYPRSILPIILRFGLLAVLFMVPAFCVGSYLHSVHGMRWASNGIPIGGMVVLAIVYHFLLKSYYRSLPCPTCGRKDLPQSHSNDRWHLLTCEACGVEWQTGLGESSGH